MGARILIVDDSPTIRKVVKDILERHEFETIDATDGLHAMQVLATIDPPDLMLVDFVMPRMNGYQLCMSVREKPELAHVPVVLMSAKGDRIRGKFVQQTGALDAITKPFDARGLIAVIESALEKKEEAAPESSLGSASHEKKSESAVNPEDDEPISRESWSDVTNGEQSILKFSRLVADLLIEKVEELDLNREQLALPLANGLNPQITANLAQLLSEAALSRGTGEALSGDLASISIAEILQLLELQRKTGTLTLSRGKNRVNLLLRDGNLDFANHSGLPEEFLLGRYLVDKGSLTRKDLEVQIKNARAAGKKLGNFLVSEDILAEETLKAALTEQTSELVYEVVRWRTGRFRFVIHDHNEDAAQLGLRAPGLVMEGFRRVDEWRLIEDSFDFEDVLFRDEMAIDNLAEHEDLRPEEQAALELIDGLATVGEIVAQLEGSSFVCCKVLYRLLNGRLVKRRTENRLA